MAIGDWEPFTSSRDENCQILEQLVAEIFALYDIKVEFRYYPWLRSLKNVESGACDASFPLMDTPERRINVIATKEPILVEENVFFYLKNKDFHWETLEDLRAYTIGGTIGYAYMTPLTDFGLDIEFVPKEELNFQKIEAGRIDIYPASKYVGIYIINKLFDPVKRNNFRYDPKPLNSQDYYLLISRKNPDAQKIADMFDEGLRQYKRNGRYSEILNQIVEVR